MWAWVWYIVNTASKMIVNTNKVNACVFILIKLEVLVNSAFIFYVKWHELIIPRTQCGAQQRRQYRYDQIWIYKLPVSVR